MASAAAAAGLEAGATAASAGAAAATTSTLATSVASFVANLGISYLLGRLTAQDGQRLTDLSAGQGEYGVGIPRLYGPTVRVVGVFIAQDDIEEHKHTAGSTALSVGIGALSGAAEGFMLGGPIGAAVGAVVGGILGFAAPKQHYYTYSDTFAHVLSDRTNDDPIEGLLKGWGGGKVIFAGTETVVSTTYGTDGKLVSKKWGKNRYFKSLTLYTGHMEQPVDPVLASVLQETSAYRPMACVVVEELQLAQFGQTVPSIEWLVQARTNDELCRIAEVIAQAAGIDHTREISTTRLAGFSVQGYALTSEINCWDALKPLMPVFGVDAAEASGSVRFIRRAQSMRSTIPLEDMGGHAYGDEVSSPLDFSRSPDVDLPQETALSFLDPARDYTENTATARRSQGNAKSNVKISIPLTMSATEGANAAATLHWDAWLGRTPAKFNLTDKWIGVEPGVAYALPVPGGVYAPFRLTKKLRGANGIIECDALSDEEVTYDADVIGTSGTAPDEESTDIADTRVIALDMSILEDAHDDYGFYLVMGGSASYWERGAIQVSNDGGTTWETLLDQPLSSVMGDVTGTLAAGTTTGLDDTLDTTSVLTVVLLHDGMTLESATDAELDDYANFVFVGKNGLGEYLQFKTATKTAARTWQLTNLRRGRKGTDFAIGTHASGEEFAVLGGPDGEGRFRIVMSDTDGWGAPLKFRGVTLHQDEADAAIINFTNTGEGKRPYSPVNVQGTWDGSNNLTITWDARSRLNAGGLGIDDQNNYEVEITSGAGRTITATGVTTASYSAADQTTDGITPGDSINGRVRQLSDVNDGRWRNFTLIGPNDFIALEDGFTPIHLEDGTTVLETE